MNPHPQLQGYPAQATHQFARLHTGRGRGKPAFQVFAGTGHALHIGHRPLGERVDAVALQRRDHSVGRADLRAIGRGVEGAIEAVIGVHPILFAEGADGMDAALGLLDQTHGFFDAEQTFEGEILGRPRQRTTAIASTGPGTADVRFDQQHIQFGVLLLEHDRGPQPGVTTADDTDIGAGVAFQWRTGFGCISLQGLVQPKGSHGVNLRSVAHTPACRRCSRRRGTGFRYAGV
ncbi:hypothetical protein D9M71_453160 [compost metagenome]